MVKITIIIEDGKDEDGNPKVDLEFNTEFKEVEKKYYASLEMPPETLAEKIGFAVLPRIVAICRRVVCPNIKASAFKWTHKSQN